MKESHLLVSLLYFFVIFLFTLPYVSSSSSSSSLKHHLCSPADASLLLQFKNHFNVDEYLSSICEDNFSTLEGLIINGGQPIKKLCWDEGSDCCKWEGVTCDASTAHVIALDLSCSNLQGSISTNSTLFQLHHLQTLNLAFNHFSSASLSHVIGGLTGLTHLNLSTTFLSGTIPSEISQLSKLVSLDLSYNFEGNNSSDLLFLHNLTKLEVFSMVGTGLSCTIPRNISAPLRYLDLSLNNIFGSIPESIFQLPKLELLILFRNWELVGSLPKLGWNCNQTLQVLDLSFTNISGELPNSISNLRSLKYFILRESSFSDFIPETIGNLTNLNVMDFEGNEFSGSVPLKISNLNQLTRLDLSNNHFEGEIQDIFSNFQQLTNLHLTGNNFYGRFPSSIVNLTQLEFLDLSENSQIGPLPSVATGLQKLQYLYLYENTLNGTIPPWVFSIPSLVYLKLEQNQFTGSLPEISCKSSLQLVDLSKNQLDGLIPDSISKLLHVEYLFLASNNFSGAIPPSVFCIPSLLNLDLSQNQFTENLPEISCKSSLISVDLSNNQLDGFIPHSISNLLHATVLNFASNNFSGEVATGIFLSIKDLAVLNFQSNHLQGPLDIAICNLTALEFLILKNNKLNGTIPQCLGEHHNLSVLDLGMNNFNWIFPTMFGKGNSLTTIALNGNQLRGPIPRSLVNCSQLEALDLGNNKLEDTFPKWFENLLELQVLVLGSNRLYGPITSFNSTIWFPSLQILDLSCNSFTGVLPKYFFSGFKGMVNVIHESQQEASYLEIQTSGLWSYDISITLMMKGYEIQLEKVLTILATIDLSSNKLEGEIPMLIGNLNALILLNLSHNYLNGSIPHQIGNLTLLESLDISWNQLVGKIPEQITQLTFLEVLNLSQNHLIGHIPRSNQFNTFGNDSYGGNLNLCGFPLSRECNDNNRSSNEHQQHVDELEDKFMSGFTWKAVVIGFCCGMVFGIFMENLMSRTGKPKWLFVTFYGNKIRKIVPRRRRNA
ncbi:PREDICTED: receptor-like protein 12 [Ipomoea nil]|uniref:receptor-like protein 12 n=1 Tax=Ipomoea nil TaxID=35883 RepID=UPI000901A39F|nr:PREDICTED: receptor-like protein 12 [Ipomoea nil]XP_019164384.1 PREDICTED: receptor-like protein 12 [Ipomoea nil]